MNCELLPSVSDIRPMMLAKAQVVEVEEICACGSQADKPC